MVKWAQRKELLYITIDLTDVESPDITITPEGKFTFKYVLSHATHTPKAVTYHEPTVM